MANQNKTDIGLIGLAVMGENLALVVLKVKTLKVLQIERLLWNQSPPLARL